MSSLPNTKCTSLAASGLLGDGFFPDYVTPLVLVLVLGRLGSAFITGTSL